MRLYDSEAVHVCFPHMRPVVVLEMCQTVPLRGGVTGILKPEILPACVTEMSLKCTRKPEVEWKGEIK